MTSFLPWQLKSELRVVFWTRELRMRGARKLDFVVKYFFLLKLLCQPFASQKHVFAFYTDMQLINPVYLPCFTPAFSTIHWLFVLD